MGETFSFALFFCAKKCCFLVLNTLWAILTLWHECYFKSWLIISAEFMPKRFSHMFMCGSLQFTCMARGGDGWQAMTVIWNALRITTGAVLHLFDFLFYSVSNFFCCCHTCSHNRGITTCVLSLRGVQMACIHLLMHLLHLRSSLRNRLMTLNVSSMSFAFSECLQITFSPNKT